MRILLLLLSTIAFIQPALHAQTGTSRPVAIVGAFPPEISILYNHLQDKQDTVIQQLHFTLGLLNGTRVVLAKTGIGKVNAAITTTLLLEHFAPRALLFSGIAGSLNPQLLPGDIVIGTAVAYHDYGTQGPDSMIHRPTRNAITLQENPLFFTCDSSWVEKARTAGKTLVLQPIGNGYNNRQPVVVTGRILTGDVFMSSAAVNQLLRKQLPAEAVEMEGAAVAQVCWQQQVPFLVIRSLSDNGDNKAGKDMNQFYQVAANNAARLVMTLLQ